MTTPANHHITVTRQGDKTARGTVLYLQPNDERWRPQRAVVEPAAFYL